MRDWHNVLFKFEIERANTGSFPWVFKPSGPDFGGVVKNKLPTLSAMVAGFLLISFPLAAHHGQAAYDLTKKITLKGTVTNFVLVNPHSIFSFDASDDQGKIKNWTMELSTPLMLMRIGWTKTILKPGDVVTVTFSPSKNGAGLGYLDNVVMADGTVLSRGGSSHVGESGVNQ